MSEPARRSATLPKIRLVPASRRYETAFLDAARRSRELHRPWSSAPTTPAGFRRYLKSCGRGSDAGYFILSPAGELTGVVNVSEVVRGPFRSAYLGYYAFAPHQGRGYMTAGLAAVVSAAFREMKLHRLEANIQPGNTASIALVKRLGFRKEGYSERYLKIGGRWRDHERWAVTVERWKRPSRAAARPATRRAR
ncbi:MAG TPA: GNAT family N-acetyltransferase [Candidatus Eisenbacteria bacterium]|nr:GNAT family N-acetyltransferase [Candidatus Eisenbacteria bacterium]